MVFFQKLVECLAERLDRREEHTALADGIAFYEVEVSVWMCPVVIVQTVASQSTKQGNVLDLRNVGQIDACRIALELDVEAEPGLLYIRSEVVDVFHHQLPVVL